MLESASYIDLRYNLLMSAYIPCLKCLWIYRLPISRAHAINVIPDDDLTESTRETLATQREDDIGFRLRLGLIRRVDSRNALPPNHVVPNHYFVFVPFESEGEQSSLITV